MLDILHGEHLAVIAPGPLPGEVEGLRGPVGVLGQVGGVGEAGEVCFEEVGKEDMAVVAAAAAAAAARGGAVDGGEVAALTVREDKGKQVEEEGEEMDETVGGGLEWCGDHGYGEESMDEAGLAGLVAGWGWDSSGQAADVRDSLPPLPPSNPSTQRLLAC